MLIFCSCDVQHQEDQEVLPFLSEIGETRARAGKEIADVLGDILGYVIFASIILFLAVIWFLTAIH